MWAVQIQGTIAYDKGLVALSILIAVVAATAALWFTLVLESPVLRFVAGLVMGVAVVGMHYTGMAAVRVTVDGAAPVPGGPEVFSFLFPVFVIGLFVLFVPITAIMLAPDREATGSRSASHPAHRRHGDLGEPSRREQVAAADIQARPKSPCRGCTPLPARFQIGGQAEFLNERLPIRPRDLIISALIPHGHIVAPLKSMVQTADGVATSDGQWLHTRNGHDHVRHPRQVVAQEIAHDMSGRREPMPGCGPVHCRRRGHLRKRNRRNDRVGFRVDHPDRVLARVDGQARVPG